MMPTEAPSVLSILKPQASAERAAATLDPAGAVQAGTEFEAVFMSMMVKQLRETLEGGFFGEEKSDTFGAMFDMYLGQHLAESQPLGIGKAIETYVQRSANP